MKRRAAKWVSRSAHNRDLAALNKRIEELQSRVKCADEERTVTLNTLRKTTDFADELSRVSKARFAQMAAEIAELQLRIGKIEPFVLGCLDDEQRSLVRAMGLTEVDYAMQYLKILHENRHIIQQVRNIQ